MTAWLRALRPRQWTKNLLVYAPLLFAKAARNPESWARASAGVLAFCFAASAVYLHNDWRDREQDRLHPEKRLRPIAAGQLGGLGALVLGGLCLLGAAACAAWLGPAFGWVLGAYLGLQLVYTHLLKRFVVVDVLCIALGFVLRVVAGGAAIFVPVSNWLLLCTLLFALFVGFAKRRHELSSLGDDALAHRQNLGDYSLPFLDQMMSVVSSSCILAYALYSVSADTVAHVGSDRLKFTVPFVVYGIFRYLFLVHRRNAGGSPERVLFQDLPLQLDAAAYLAVVTWALYF